jgi:long-chain acyl-CoA synthetase
MLSENIGILESDSEAPTATGVSTVTNLLLYSADRYSKPDAFKIKSQGQWKNVSTAEFLLEVEELFFGLKAVGIRAGDRVAIMSENRLEWAVADYASLCLGAVVVPIYPTLSAAQVDGLLQNSRPALVFVSTAEALGKLRSVTRRCFGPYVVIFDAANDQSGVMRLDDIYDMGRSLSRSRPGEFRRTAMAVAPEDVATIIYTSGTTGVPKGAMLTHRNLVSNVMATCQVLPIYSWDLSLSFLPLSHIFQRHVDYATFYAGASIAYAENLAAVAENMAEVRPTFAAGVPRFFEKMHSRIMAEVMHGPKIRRALFSKALQIGHDYVRTGQPTRAYSAANKLVFQKIRQRLGGRIRMFISGGAALAPEIGEFFFAVGLPVFEGYGLTETSPVITLNGPAGTRIGTVGRVIGDVQLRIADDGEILVRGSNVMKGYYRMRRETNHALREGWFHTGDVGTMDGDGFLTITDRKKDLIVTSSGKNIAPQPIENRLKLIPYFENVVLVGDGRNFISALLVPDYDALAEYARAHGIQFDKPAELIHKREIHDLAMREIERHTADLASFEKIGKVAFLEKDFTIDGGELTPTLKVRRSAVEKKFSAQIDLLYAA